MATGLPMRVGVWSSSSTRAEPIMVIRPSEATYAVTERMASSSPGIRSWMRKVDR